MTLSDLEKVTGAFALKSFDEPGTGLERYWFKQYRVYSRWLRVFCCVEKV